MRNRLLMHILKAVKHLPNVMLDVVHRDVRFHLFSLSQCVFETAIAILHHRVLNDPLLLVDGVEELDKLHDVRTVFEERKDLILT